MEGGSGNEMDMYMISLGKGNSIQKRIGSDNKKEDIIEDAIDSILED